MSGHRSTAGTHSMAATDLMMMLLQEFDYVFTTSTGIPPPRRHNHHIHLLLKTAIVVVQSYRYLQLVKDELKRQCKYML
jgi:hypothetical protein